MYRSPSPPGCRSVQYLLLKLRTDPFRLYRDTPSSFRVLLPSHLYGKFAYRNYRNPFRVFQQNMGKRSGYGKKRKHGGNAAENDAEDGNRDESQTMTTRGEGKTSAEIHPGSYASSQMRKMFGVDLPELDDVEKKGDHKSEDDGEENGEADSSEKKRIKRKVAFLLAYLGTNYSG